MRMGHLRPGTRWAWQEYLKVPTWALCRSARTSIVKKIVQVQPVQARRHQVGWDPHSREVSKVPTNKDMQTEPDLVAQTSVVSGAPVGVSSVPERFRGNSSAQPGCSLVPSEFSSTSEPSPMRELLAPSRMTSGPFDR